MRVIKLVLFIFLFTVQVVNAQSEDESAIRQLEVLWTQLLDQGDTTALLNIWSEDYVVNNPNGKIVTPKDIVTIMKSGHKFPTVERMIEKITFNDNIAVVMGKELQQPPNMVADKDQWIPRRFTNVWIKTDAGWQLAARQSSKIAD